MWIGESLLEISLMNDISFMFTDQNICGQNILRIIWMMITFMGMIRTPIDKQWTNPPVQTNASCYGLGNDHVGWITGCYALKGITGGPSHGGSNSQGFWVPGGIPCWHRCFQCLSRQLLMLCLVANNQTHWWTIGKPINVHKCLVLGPFWCINNYIITFWELQKCATLFSSEWNVYIKFQCTPSVTSGCEQPFEQDSMTNMVSQFLNHNFVGWFVTRCLPYLVAYHWEHHSSQGKCGCNIELSAVLFTANHLCHRDSHGSTTQLVAPHLATCPYESLKLRDY